LDFGESEPSAATINQWVEENTDNKIKNLITADSLNSDTRMVLVNAIYFKALWQYEFDVKRTQKAPFFLNEIDYVDVDYMIGKSTFRHGENKDLDANVLELPYKETDITMLIILPKKKRGLGSLERKLNAINFSEISSGLKSEEIRIYIPKFKIEFDIQLKEPLEKVSVL